MVDGYWDTFYSSQDARRVPELPSAFARHVAEQLPRGARVLDVGTGTGRDALFFDQLGHDVHAVDLSPSAIARLQQRSRDEGRSAVFETLDLADIVGVSDLASRLATGEPVALYARFFLHAIPEDVRRNFWVLAGLLASPGMQCWLEFRVSDELQPVHEFGDHFRCSLQVGTILEEARSVNLAVDSYEVGHGLAPYKSEDPLVARVVLSAPVRVPRAALAETASRRG